MPATCVINQSNRTSERSPQTPPIRYVRNFMRNHPIPQYTKIRVINHFEYLFNRSENILQARAFAPSPSHIYAKWHLRRLKTALM